MPIHRCLLRRPSPLYLWSRRGGERSSKRPIKFRVRSGTLEGGMKVLGITSGLVTLLLSSEFVGRIQQHLVFTRKLREEISRYFCEVQERVF
ncbi:unnamed protein product [Larinioides sclopetarius]|uniref:Uncharacterized protein n=1 Tax=Larinioides sclopetarius TaxID=280406 RepID=A0AAV2B4W9_9ARAC